MNDVQSSTVYGERIEHGSVLRTDVHIMLALVLSHCNAFMYSLPKHVIFQGMLYSMYVVMKENWIRQKNHENNICNF